MLNPSQISLPPPLWPTLGAGTGLPVVQPDPGPGDTSHPITGLIGKRNLQPRGWTSTNTSYTYRVRYPVTVTASKLRMTFPAWSTVTAGVGDEPSGNTITLGAVYAEYAGSLYPVTFRSGFTSWMMASGDAITSDEIVGLVVAAGTTLYIRTYVTVPTSGRWPNLYGAYTFPDEVARPGTNLANAVGDLQGTGQTVSDLYGPLRVFGELAGGQPFYAITVCGDSISAGTNDSFSTEAAVGYWQRALWPGNRPFSIVALPGENGTQLLAQGANRADIVGEYVDYVINQYGINDLQTGATLAQLQARSFANTVISRNPWVNQRLQQTLGPKSASTDGWVTAGNQTTDTINAARVAFNDWVRAGQPEIGQTAVAVGTAGAVLAGQGGHPYTGYIEVADLCETARNSGIWKPNYTSDGLHPNASGNAAIAAALDLSVFTDTFPTSGTTSSGLVRDASTPAMRSSAFQGAAASQAWASNSFSPPAGSVIVAVLSATQSFNNAWNAPTVTDSLGSHLTWTVAATQADVSVATAVSAVWIAWAYCPSAQTGMTVTATYSLAGTGQTVTFSTVGIEVFTGAHTTAPIGTIAQGLSTSTAVSATVAPAGSNSALLLAASNAGAASVTAAAGTGEYMDQETHTGTSVAILWYGNAAGPTLGGTSQTLDVTEPASPRTQYIGFEVKSAPAGATYNAVVGLTATASITAAAGLTLASPATTLSGSASITAAAGLTLASPATTLSGSASITAAAFATRPAAASVAGVATISASAFLTLASPATTLSGSASITAAAALATSSGASVAGVATLSAAAFTTLSAAATLSGAGAISASAFLTLTSPVTTLSGVATVSASGFLTLASGATLSGSGTITATASVAAGGATTASLAGAATIVAGAVLGGVSGATAAATGTITAGVLLVRSVAASVAGTATLSAGAFLTLASGANILAGTAILSASAFLTLAPAATLSGSGTVTASAFTTLSAAVTLSGSGTIMAAATAITPGSAAASLTGVATLSAALLLTRVGSASLLGTAILSASAFLTLASGATLSGSASIVSAAAAGYRIAAVLAISAQISAQMASSSDIPPGGTLTIGTRTLPGLSEGLRVDAKINPSSRATGGIS